MLVPTPLSLTHACFVFQILHCLFLFILYSYFCMQTVSTILSRKTNDSAQMEKTGKGPLIMTFIGTSGAVHVSSMKTFLSGDEILLCERFRHTFLEFSFRLVRTDRKGISLGDGHRMSMVAQSSIQPSDFVLHCHSSSHFTRDSRQMEESPAPL
jgi:hypothetical protein